MAKVKGPSYFLAFADGKLSVTHDAQPRQGDDKIWKLVDFLGLLRHFQRDFGLRPPTSPKALRAIAKELDCNLTNCEAAGVTPYRSKVLVEWTCKGRTANALTIPVPTITTGGQNRPSIKGGTRTVRSYDPTTTGVGYPAEMVDAVERIIEHLEEA